MTSNDDSTGHCWHRVTNTRKRSTTRIFACCNCGSVGELNWRQRWPPTTRDELCAGFVVGPHAELRAEHRMVL